jgi:hypothetical protein
MRLPGKLPAALLLACIALAPSQAGASWVMEPDEQHAVRAKCPRGFQLVSVEAGDADLLVCAPRSRRAKRTQPEQAKLPSDQEGPLEGPKFD